MIGIGIIITLWFFYYAPYQSLNNPEPLLSFMHRKLTYLIEEPYSDIFQRIIYKGPTIFEPSEEVGKVLASNLSTIYLIPDEGIPLDFAKSYKKFGGKEVVGAIPKGGCDILEKYFQFCDRTEKVDGGWSVLNTCLSLKTGLMIGFGLSPGTLVEIAYTKYHKEYLGRNIPILLDERTISGRLNPEVEDEVDLRYFSSAGELKFLLKKLRGQ